MTTTSLKLPGDIKSQAVSAAKGLGMLAGGYAFTPRLSLYAAYLNFTTSGTANNNNSVLVAGNYRF